MVSFGSSSNMYQFSAFIYHDRPAVFESSCCFCTCICIETLKFFLAQAASPKRAGKFRLKPVKIKPQFGSLWPLCAILRNDLKVHKCHHLLRPCPSSVVFIHGCLLWMASTDGRVIHGWHPRMTLPSMDDISPSMDDIHGWHFSIHGRHPRINIPQM